MFQSILTLAQRFRDVNWALVDQAMVSGANFLTQVMLARYLGVTGYGQFVLAWMAIEFVRIIQEPLMTLPMVIIGPKQTSTNADSYYSAVCFSQFILGATTSTFLFLTVLVLNVVLPSWNLDGLAGIMGITALTCHLQDFLRRYAFARQFLKTAVACDATRFLGQVAVYATLFHTNSLNVNTALIATASAAFLAILCALPIVLPIRLDRQTFLWVIPRHWNFSKWLVPSAILGRTTGDLFMATAGAVIGAAAVGGLRATQNLVAVTHILLMGLENVIPVRAAKRLDTDGKAGLTQFLWHFGLIGGSTMGIILLIVAATPEFWLTLIYGEQFSGQGYIVQWWACIYFLFFLSKPGQVGLRAMEHTRPIFWQNLVLAAISVAACYPLIETFGVIGVMSGMMLVEIFRVSILSFSLRRRLRVDE
jgi:O-antigen/teichoic acid export membrane protein